MQNVKKSHKTTEKSLAYIINRITFFPSNFSTMSLLLLNEASFGHAVFCEMILDIKRLQCFWLEIFIDCSFGYKLRQSDVIGLILGKNTNFDL